MEKKQMSTEKVVTTANDTNDAVAERVLKAFDGHDGYLNDADLIKAAGIPREEYLTIRDWLIEDTQELMEFEPGDEQAHSLYGRIPPMRGKREVGISQSRGRVHKGVKRGRGS
jgi:hypothetical protein